MPFLQRLASGKGTGALIAAKLAALAGGQGDRATAGRMALAAFAIRVASAAIAYLTQILLARWMGGHEYGVFVSVWVWVLVLGGIAGLGFETSVVRFIPEYSKRGETGLLRGFLLGSRAFVLMASTLIAAFGALVAWLLGDIIHEHYLTPVYLALVCLPLYTLTGVQDGMARPFNWTDLALGPPYLWRPILMLAVMAAIFWAGAPADAASAMAAAVIATWIVGIAQFLMLNRRLATRIERGPRDYRLGFWIKTSLPLFLVEGFYLLLTNTDVLVLAWFVPADQVAIYFATVKTLALVSFVYFAVVAASSHKFAEYHAAGDTARLEAMVRDAVAWTFWPSVLGGIVMLAVGRPFLWLFGPQFVDGYPLMAILLVGLTARASVGPVERLLNMMGHQNRCAVVYGTTFMVNLCLNLALIPFFGLYGAAIGTASALVLESILLFWTARRLTGLNVSIWSAFGRKAS